MKPSLRTTMAACLTLLTGPLSALAADGLTVSTEAGLGYDSNAYRTPDAAYIDYARGGLLTLPNVQSGYFVPLQLKVNYQAETLLATYRFDGDVYLNSSLQNANRYDNDVTLGGLFNIGQSGSLYAGALGGYHKRTYYDRDTGLDYVTTVSGTNVSNRYTYVNYGIEAELDNSVNNIDYTIASELTKRNYDNPVKVSELDHLYFDIGGDVKFPLADIASLKLGYTFTYRDYDDRPSHLADGTFPAAKVLLTYSYHTFDATLRSRLGKALVAYLEYSRSYRKDGYVGYNDYTKDKVKVRLRLKLSDALKLRAWAAWQKSNYPHAFAFDVAGQPQKDYDSISGAIKAEYALAATISAWGEFRYINQNSSDLRYAYKRYQAMAGVRWEL